MSLGRFIILMTLEPTPAHGTRPFDGTGKELKCEALTNAVVISRRQSEIPRTISGGANGEGGEVEHVAS